MDSKRVVPVKLLSALGLKACVGLLVILFCFTAFAQDIPPRPSPPKLVNDLAKMLSEDEKNQLEYKLDAYADSTSTQIVIVTIDALGDEDPNVYGYKLGDKWGVGQKQKDNGVVILISKTDHKIAIDPGRGMEGVLTDVICRNIIENYMRPDFRQQHFYNGLDEATTIIIKLAAGEFVSDINKDKKGLPVGAIIVIVIVILFILSRIGRNGGGGGVMSRGGWLAGPILWGGGGGGGGFSGGGGGGGFGGFGGGSFGGGGASGSW